MSHLARKHIQEFEKYCIIAKINLIILRFLLVNIHYSIICALESKAKILS